VPDEALTPPVALADITPSPMLDEAAPPLEGASGDATTRRNRGRRRRGGRGGRSQEATMSDAVNPEDQQEPVGQETADTDQGATSQLTAEESSLLNPEPHVAQAPASVASAGAAVMAMQADGQAEHAGQAPAAVVEPARAAPAPVAQPAPIAPAIAATPAQAEPVVPSAQVASATAAVEEPAPESLPIADLNAVVQAAGLQWVQSDPIRVEQAQRTLRQMIVPKQAPRQRKPLALADEGPLMLVETRKALPTLNIPENNGPAG
jgi:ribonuclease E